MFLHVPSLSKFETAGGENTRLICSLYSSGATFERSLFQHFVVAIHYEGVEAALASSVGGSLITNTCCSDILVTGG